MDNDKANQPTPAAPSRRRGSGPAFEGLMNQKRASDPSSLARRASLHDQKPQAGFFGRMWNEVTRADHAQQQLHPRPQQPPEINSSIPAMERENTN
ncbi:hypothetical protein F5Y11DRAFT_344696 [Daldinia sp. FL1419]|nr:hypothetical protein F5Y11DRAFT_344696 [Daldinia sp. FL1419]